MATAAKAVKDATFLWEGMDKRGKKVKGQMQAGGETVVNSQLRRQGISVTKVKKQSTLFAGGKRISDKDVTLFTRQLATMMKAGVPRTPITTPATAGPAIRARLKTALFSAMAFAIPSRPTISTAKVCRVGLSTTVTRPSAKACSICARRVC